MLKLTVELAHWRRARWFFLIWVLLTTTFTTTALRAEESATLTLAQAIDLTLQKNPALKVFPLRERALQGDAMTQAQRPPLSVVAELENVAGSGPYTGFDSAELTLALSSVLELGDKRDARVAVVEARKEQVDGERQVQALDLLGEVTRRFVEVAAAQERLTLARDAELLAQETLQSVQQRAQAGAAPEADVARARAAQAQARLTLASAQGEWNSAKVRLAAEWGDTQPAFARVAGNLFDLGDSGDFADLQARTSQHPALLVLAGEARLRDAELRLVRSQASTDISWSGGVREGQASDEAALVASVSVPLFSGRRNAGAVQSALAARDEVAVQREVALLQLRDQLHAAFEQRRQALELANGLRREVIPLLEQAMTETRTAYERGRYGYLEWVGARNELITARRALIEAAYTAQRTRADIEQLTAQPLTTD